MCNNWRGGPKRLADSTSVVGSRIWFEEYSIQLDQEQTVANSVQLRNEMRYPFAGKVCQGVRMAPASVRTNVEQDDES